jgi:hypothetical protein
MPSQLQRLQLRFASCAPGSASCEEHEKIKVRIRKRDLENLEENSLHYVEMYAQCAPSEALRIRQGSILQIELTQGSTFDFTVVAIHVLPSLSKRNGLVRTCILSGYVSKYTSATPKNKAVTTTHASGKSSKLAARHGPSNSTASTGDT